jgi:hypothetical protein
MGGGAVKHAHDFTTWADRKRELDREWLGKRPDRASPAWSSWLLNWGYAQQALERARQKELWG